MSCQEASQREQSLFGELQRAVARRERVDAKLAVFDDHWEGYEAALSELEAAVQAYGIVAKELRDARARHNGA
jgi:hypothetical protein